MAITLTLKGGEKDFDLIYGSSEDVPVAVMAESIQEESMPRPLWHRPGGGDGNELVELGYDDARWPLLVQLGPADDWSELLEELSTLRRVIRQAHAHALGEPWADEVYIECRPDATASKTYYTVKLVEDRSGGFLMGTRVAEVLIDTLALTVTVAGDGYGDEESLNNAHRNGHMLVESATGGLASGLAVHGTPTVTLDTGTKLIGAQSQKVVTDASTGEGVRSATTTAAQNTDAVVYIWVAGLSGDHIELHLFDGSSNSIDNVNFYPDDSTEVADKTVEDGDGNTWYRISLSGENTAAANFYVRVARLSGPATQVTTWYCDGLYLELDQTVVPEAWTGYPQVYNRNDPDSTNPEYVNRFDVWGIPGDRPAWMELVFDTSAVGGVSYLKRTTIGRELVAENIDAHLIDGEDFENGWTETADGASNGGNYERLTGYSSLIADKNMDPAVYNGVYHVLVRARTSNVSTELYLRKQVGNVVTECEQIVFSATNRWQLHYAGLLDLRLSSYRQGMANADFELSLRPLAQSGQTLDFDYVILFPARAKNLMILNPDLALLAGDELHIVGREQVVLGEAGTDNIEEPMAILGGVWTAESGILNRFIFAFAHEDASGDECLITYDSEITSFSYRPRTRGFLA